jgi:hypothetical protein
VLAVKAQCDGKRVILPNGGDFPAGSVIVVFEETKSPGTAEQREWMRIQESSFAKVWDNDDDAIYDAL